jgi:hypothetical protein
MEKRKLIMGHKPFDHNDLERAKDIMHAKLKENSTKASESLCKAAGLDKGKLDKYLGAPNGWMK